jgi:hypothetical protein
VIGVDEMRALLNLGSEVSDADVIAAYSAYLLEQPAPDDTNATVVEFRIRYPAFTAVGDETVAYWLTDSLRIVTADWGSDAIPAQMAFAAHEMSSRGVLPAVGASAIPAGVTRFRSASMDVAISEAAANRGLAGGYSTTVYGQEFAIFLRRNRGGPRLVGCA